VLAGGAAALAMTLGAAPAASAADAVFGGSTSASEAIVIKADKTAKKLRSAVIGWSAKCGDGMYFDLATELTPSSASPGFSPEPSDLLVSRNRKGSFAGTQLAGQDLGDATAAVKVTLTGRLRPKSASGTLSADVTIIENAGGNTQTTCRTGRLSWKATRAPGRVYGGRTSQEEPVVAKIDAKRKRVTDLLVSWHGDCVPSGFARFSDALRNFPAASTGRFGDRWNQTVNLSEGGKRTFDYSVAGKLGRRSARGTLRIAITDADAAGATTASCDTGGVTWKATTG
jgi:hypothetical protein